jgi:hypothetical protein
MAEADDELGDRPLTRKELALQKKGIVNLSAGELQEWIRLCERKGECVRATKARRSWKASRFEAEERRRLLGSRRESQD